MKKVLFVSNTDRHILLCHIPYLKYFHNLGYKVYVASNTNTPIEYCDVKINLNLTRNPFKINNFLAIFKLKKIIDAEHFDIVHVHTPTGETIGRLASIGARKKGTKVLYTAHGLHFFKGCKITNYILYYPLEHYLMRHTDVLITMNEEDYNFSKKHFKKTKIEFIPGIGFNKERLEHSSTKEEIDSLKKELHIKKEFVISYVAEISKRKRQTYLLKILSKMDMKGIKVLLVGENRLGNKFLKLIEKYHLKNKVLVLGFRKDINTILDITDLVISVSSQEGLPLNILEALYKKKCILATKERGVLDLIHDGNGILVGKNDKIAFTESIVLLKSNPSIRKSIVSKINGIEDYSSEALLKIMDKIYEKYK